MKRHRWLILGGMLLCCGFILGLLANGVADVRGMAARAIVNDPVPTGVQQVSTVHTVAAAVVDEAASLSTNIFIPLILHDFPPDEPEIVIKGRLDIEELTMSTLSAGSRDRWTMNLNAGESITLTVAPGSSANILFSILDPNDNVIVNRHNLAPTGEPEAISNVAINTPGTHSVIIETEQGVQTDYAMMLMNADSLNFVFRGLIVDSTTKNDSLPENTDHFWFTNLTSGQVLSMSVTPTETGDAYVEIYGPDGSRELTLDDGSEGETEKLDGRAFPNAGMYGIRVAEFDFLPMSYRLTVIKS